MANLKNVLRSQLNLIQAVLSDQGCLQKIDEIAVELAKCYVQRKGKLLVAGNGGSAAEAQHLAAEIVCQFVHKRKGHPALALTVDCSIITAWANDHCYADIFARQVEAYGRAGDVLLLLSTSGESENLVKAAEVAASNGITVVGLLGKGGGMLLEHCHIAFVVPSNETPRIQEMHLLLLHYLCEELDERFVEMSL